MICSECGEPIQPAVGFAARGETGPVPWAVVETNDLWCTVSDDWEHHPQEGTPVTHLVPAPEPHECWACDEREEHLMDITEMGDQALVASIDRNRRNAAAYRARAKAMADVAARYEAAVIRLEAEQFNRLSPAERQARAAEHVFSWL